MTLNELRAKYKAAYKIIERQWRRDQQMFRSDPVALQQRRIERDLLIKHLTDLKDALKPHVEAGFEQPPLMDVPQRTNYR